VNIKKEKEKERRKEKKNPPTIFSLQTSQYPETENRKIKKGNEAEQTMQEFLEGWARVGFNRQRRREYWLGAFRRGAVGERAWKEYAGKDDTEGEKGEP
jgi:hypothetical protein